MRNMLKTLGILLVICGVVIFLIAGVAQEETKPNNVSVGMMVNGQFVETDSGQIGGNATGYENTNSLKVIGLLAGSVGIIMMVTSVAIKE